MAEKQIDFYTSVAQPEQFACLLVQKVYKNSQRLLVLFDNERELAEFSRRLWCLGDTVFVPHCLVNSQEAVDSKIWLATQIPECDCPPLLLNLTQNDMVNYANSFSRVLEIVGCDATAIANARQRFRCYREGAFNIKHHDMSKL